MLKLYVALENELLIVTRRGSAWQSEAQLAGLPIQCLAADPRRPANVYCGTFGKGLWRSQDGGASWSPANQGLSLDQVTALAVSRPGEANGQGTIWAGTEPSSLFRSDDEGSTWRMQPALLAMPSRATWSFPPRPSTHHVRWIEPDAAVPGRLFVCIEAGALLRSFDGGKTFEDRRPDSPRDSHTLRTHRLAPGWVYAAAGDGYGHPGRGYAYSYDGGDTWGFFGEGLRYHYLWGLAVDPGNPALVIVSAARSPEAAHDRARAESTLYRRLGNAPWQEVTAGLPDPSGTLSAVLATNETEPGVFYAASNRGLYRSADGGLSWERLGVQWPEPNRPQALVVTGEP